MSSEEGPGIPSPEAKPGWYPDPWHITDFRWFDGTQWTGAVTAAALGAAFDRSAVYVAFGLHRLRARRGS